MKKFLTHAAASASLLLTPFVTFAQFAPSGGNFGTLLTDILNFSTSVLIPFILAIGFLVFVWGMFRYFIAGGADEGARENGKNLMIYATLGFVLIIILWGVV
ncbi:hypothetical protein KC887_07105, partial [Candidatus Kaiserbacteria bacterium]|nr:hypothetical protein [Candidatus Kaiserbacteria bacterium]